MSSTVFTISRNISKPIPGIWTKVVIVLVKVVNCRSEFLLMVKSRQVHKVYTFVSNILYNQTDRFFLTEFVYVGLSLLAQVYIYWVPNDKYIVPDLQATAN